MRLAAVFKDLDGLCFIGFTATDVKVLEDPFKYIIIIALLLLLLLVISFHSTSL